MRWTIELDYKQLKGHFGLNHFEGRSWAGWHKHRTLATVAHAWLTEQRLDPKSPAAGLTLPQAIRVLAISTGRCPTCQRRIRIRDA